MKITCLFWLVFLALVVPAVADYRVNPATQTLNQSAQATNSHWGYIQRGQMGTIGQDGLVLPGSGSTTRVITFPNNTGGAPRVFEWGWCGGGTVSASFPFHPTMWFREEQVGSGIPSQYGPVANGKYYDPNGTQLDPDTGLPINPEENKPQANIDLPSLFPDRPTDYQIMMTDAATGELLGMGNATSFPGGTNGLTLTADRPFNYTFAPVIDGISDPSLGGSGSSTGGTSVNAGNPVVIPPNITHNSPVITPNPNPTATPGTDTAAVKGAIDRLAGIALQGFNDNKVANGLMLGVLDDIRGAVDGLATQPTGGEGDDLTQAEVQAAVTAGVNAVLGEGRGAITTDQGQAQAAIDGKGTVLAGIANTKLAVNGAITAMGGLVDGLGLGRAYGKADIAFAVNFGPFGSFDVSLANYGDLFDIIREVALWVMGLRFVMAYFKIVRGALVG